MKMIFSGSHDDLHLFAGTYRAEQWDATHLSDSVHVIYVSGLRSQDIIKASVDPRVAHFPRGDSDALSDKAVTALAPFGVKKAHSRKQALDILNQGRNHPLLDSNIPL